MKFISINSNSEVEDHKFRTFNFAGTSMPLHGWKVHVSASFRNSEHVREIVVSFCNRKRVNFKIIKDQETYLKLLFKSHDRISANKFATLYPKDSEHAREVIEELYPLVKHLNGPFVFTDFSYKNSIIYYRYGEFFSAKYRKKNFPNDSFADKREINNPNPFNFSPLYAEAEETQLKGFRKKEYTIKDYKILLPIYFSTYGGVYLARKNKKLYVIKEAFPYTGYREGTNHITRKKYECQVIRRLSSQYFPTMIENFYIDANFYSVFIHQKGLSLEAFRNQWSFSSKWNTLGKRKEEIEKGLLALTEKLLNILKKARKIGLVLNDVTTNNFIWNGGHKISFVDLDLSFFEGKNRIQILDNFRRIEEKPSSFKDVVKVGYLLADILFGTSLFQNNWTDHNKLVSLFKETSYYYKINPILYTRILYFLNFKPRQLLKFPKEIMIPEEIIIKLPTLNTKKAKRLYFDWIIFVGGDEYPGQEIANITKDFEKAYMIIKEGDRASAEGLINSIIMKNTMTIEGHIVFKKTDELVYPFLNDGAAKLVLLMLIYKEKFDNKTFDKAIFELSSHLMNKFILKSSFFDGIAGLIYIFIKLFFAFEKQEFLLAAREFADLLVRWLSLEGGEKFFGIDGNLIAETESKYIKEIIECFEYEPLRCADV